MFMKIDKPVAINDVEEGFLVTLFDNRKGQKDHSIKTMHDLRLTFTRIIRNGYVTLFNQAPTGKNDDEQYVRFHDTPNSQSGFKIENVKINMSPNTEGKAGYVTAIIRPFGPCYVELRKAIENKEDLNFELVHTVDTNRNIHRVLSVAYKPRQASLVL